MDGWRLGAQLPTGLTLGSPLLPSAATALFNGVGLTLVKQAPTMAITFAAFEVRCARAANAHPARALSPGCLPLNLAYTACHCCQDCCRVEGGTWPAPRPVADGQAIPGAVRGTAEGQLRRGHVGGGLMAVRRHTARSCARSASVHCRPCCA